MSRLHVLENPIVYTRTCTTTGLSVIMHVRPGQFGGPNCSVVVQPGVKSQGLT